MNKNRLFVAILCTHTQSAVKRGQTVGMDVCKAVTYLRGSTVQFTP